MAKRKIAAALVKSRRIEGFQQRGKAARRPGLDSAFPLEKKLRLKQHKLVAVLSMCGRSSHNGAPCRGLSGLAPGVQRKLY